MSFPTGGTPTTTPLPTGAATAARQDTGNTLLDTISDTLLAEAEAAPRTAFGEQSHKIIRQIQLNNGERITVDDLKLDLSPGQSVTIALTPSANNMRTRVSLSGHEIH